MSAIVRGVLAYTLLFVAACAGSAEWDRGPHEIALLPGSQGQLTIDFIAEGSYADEYSFSATVDDPTAGVTAGVNPAQAEVDGEPVAVTVTIAVDAASTATRANVKVEAEDSSGEVPAMTSVFVTIEQP